MGQVTLPVTNRKGYSAAWDNKWENKLLYTQKINEDIFIKQFFKIFLKNWLSSHHVLLDFNQTLHKKKIRPQYYDYKESESSLDIYNLLKYSTNRKFPYYTSKIFLVRYGSWLLLYTYTYIPRTWYKRFGLKKIKINNYSYIYDLYKYHTTKLFFFKNKKLYRYTKK